MVITNKESLSSLPSSQRECSHLSRFQSPEGDEWIDNSQRNAARASIEERWWFHGPQANRKFLVTFKIRYLKSFRKPWEVEYKSDCKPRSATATQEDKPWVGRQTMSQRLWLMRMDSIDRGCSGIPGISWRIIPLYLIACYAEFSVN